MNDESAQNKKDVPEKLFGILGTTLGRSSESVPCVFLVGAGISRSNPSNLLPCSLFMRGVLRRLFPKEEEFSRIEPFLDPASPKRSPSGMFLRFEALMEILLAQQRDPKVDILSCYSRCSEPNENHYMLAKALQHGHCIITTNFDTLIEEACQRLGIPFSTVVYESDFGDFLGNPRHYRNPIFKIHGSFRKGAINTCDSLRAAVSHLDQAGLAMAGEPHKRQVLETLLRAHSFIVLGYSGSDSLDISPVLKRNATSNALIWINHSDIPHYYSQLDLDALPRDGAGRFISPHHEVVGHLSCDGSGAQRVHLFDFETSLAVRWLNERWGMQNRPLGPKYEVNYEEHFDAWFTTCLSSGPDRALAQFTLWEFLEVPEGWLSSIEIVRAFAQDNHYGNDSAQVLVQLGDSYCSHAEYEKAHGCYWAALEIEDRLEHSLAVSSIHLRLANVLKHGGMVKQSLACLGQVVTWASRALDQAKTPRDRCEALACRAQGLLDRILAAHESGYPMRWDISREDARLIFGDWEYEGWKDTPTPPTTPEDRKVWQTLGWAPGKYQRWFALQLCHASAYCDAALQIAVSNSFVDLQISCYKLNGEIVSAAEDTNAGREWILKAIRLAESSTRILDVASTAEQMYRVLVASASAAEYMPYWKRAFDVYEFLGDLRGMGGLHYNLAFRNESGGELEEAEKHYRSALQYFVCAGDRREESHVWHQLGRIAQAKKDYSSAKTAYHKALDIKLLLGDVHESAMTFRQLGIMYFEMQDYDASFLHTLQADEMWTALDSPRRMHTEAQLRDLQDILGEKRVASLLKEWREKRASG
jgi:tetratricopeptide (TPR) repeat protein